jgi:hypothetical protein
MEDNRCWTERYEAFSEFNLFLIYDECSFVRVVPVGMYSDYNFGMLASFILDRFCVHLYLQSTVTAFTLYYSLRPHILADISYHSFHILILPTVQSVQ